MAYLQQPKVPQDPVWESHDFGVSFSFNNCVITVFFKKEESRVSEIWFLFCP